MIIFQVRQGYFGQRGWRTVNFWTWFFSSFLVGCVARVVVGDKLVIEEMAEPGYNWFDKRVPRDKLHELSMHDTFFDLRTELTQSSDLIKAYRIQEKK